MKRENQLIRCLLSNFLSQHVLGIIMPIIRRIRQCPTACSAGLYCMHYQPGLPQGHYGYHILWFHLLRGRTPHAVGHGLILLMKDVMMPETCWDSKFDNKHRISCILLVLSLHLMFMMHDHKNLKLLIPCVQPDFFLFVSGWWWLGDWFLHFVFSGLNMEADFCILKGTDHLECCAEECYYCT